MRKFFVFVFMTLLLAGSANFAHAQVSQGNLLVGGHFNLNFPESDRNVNVRLNMRPSAAYFFTDALALGLSVPLVVSGSDNFTSSFFGLVPFGRYYFPVSNFYVFPELGLGFVRSSTRQRLSDGRTITRSDPGIGGSIGLGMAFFLSDNVAFEGLLSYEGRDYASPVFVTNSGLNFSFGLHIYLPWK